MRRGLTFGMAILGGLLALPSGEAAAQLNSGLGAPQLLPRALGAPPVAAPSASRLSAGVAAIIERPLPPIGTVTPATTGPAAVAPIRPAPQGSAAPARGDAPSGRVAGDPAPVFDPMPAGADPTAARGAADPRTAFLDAVAAAYPPRRDDDPGTLFFIGARDDASGRPCRIYQQTVEIDGAATTAYGTVCRQEDGSWKLVE